MNRILATGTAVLLLAGQLAAADLKVLPPVVALTDGHSTHQLLVVEETAGRVTADRTKTATFRSSNPAVATVAADGILTPVGDGESEIVATANGRTATAKVTVSRTKATFATSFRNHVEPTLTRIGC